MPKKTGITDYTCDRCAKQQYIAEGEPAASDWREVSRVTADGVASSRLLCKECTTRYRKLATEQDTAFNAFMANTEE